MKNELIEQAQQTLWSRDFLGYSFEMGNIEVLKKHGLYKFVKYRNPKKPYSWKRKKGIGVDMVLKVHDYTVYVEESYNGSSYPYRKSWFKESRLPRFKGYPRDEFHLWVLLTNKPRNFNSIKELAEEHETQIMNINGLLKLVRNLIKKSTERSFTIPSSTLSDYLSSNSNTVTVRVGVKSNKSRQIEHVYAYDKGVEKTIERLTKIDFIEGSDIYEKLNRLKELQGYYEFS